MAAVYIPPYSSQLFPQQSQTTIIFLNNRASKAKQIMAVVGNRKQLTSLLLLCIITSAVIPPWAMAQVSCGDVGDKLSPCTNYVKVGGGVPAECCEGLKAVVDSLKTKLDRQSACECIKAVVSKATPEQQKRAQGLPTYCKVPFPFKIGPDVDCSVVSKTIY